MMRDFGAPVSGAQSYTGEGVPIVNPQWPAGDVRRYGAKLDGSDDTTAVQNAITATANIFAAIAVMVPVYTPGLARVNNLVQTLSGQIFRGEGARRTGWVKNANGAICTFAGDDVECHDMSWRGVSASFTGHNVVYNGARARFVNCDSVDAAGRALLAPGDGHVIDGGVWQTADATAAGQDIELGTLGVATLYHKINYKSQQSTGGLLLNDTGSVMVAQSQFGKYTIAASGTPGPAGTNAGMVVCSRVTGTIAIGQSNGLAAAVQFGAATFTIAANTSGSSYAESNIWEAGAVITNNGNKNNVIVRQTSGGTTIALRYGDDASLSTLTFDPGGGGITVSKNFTITNGRNLVLQGSAAGTDFTLSMTAGNNAQIQNAAAGALQLLAAAAQVVQIAQGGTVKQFVDTDGTWNVSSSKLVTPTYGANVTIDASLGGEFVITATNGTAFTINTPTNPRFTGQKIIIRVRNTSGGALGAVTMGAGFKSTISWVIANGNSRSSEFTYDGTNWIQTRITMADIPN